MPFTGSNITFTVAFSVSNDFKNGQAAYTGTTAYPGTYGIALADVTETISFYQPGNSGGSPFATATINCGVTRSASVNLPKGTDGKVIQGEYTVMVTAVVAGGVDPGTYTTPDSPAIYHEFCPGTLALDIAVEVDCLTAIMSVTDDTAYAANGWTISSRTMTLNGPILTGASPVYTISGSGDTVSTTGQILYAKTYTWNITVTMTKDTTTLTLTASGSKLPDCASFCTMLCSLKRADAMLAANPRLVNSFTMAMNQFNLAYNSQRCDSSDVSIYMDAFWTYMAPFGITSDCSDCCDGCSDDDVIQPLIEGAGAGTYTFVEGTPTWISVGTVGTTITIGLTAQGLAYMSAISTYDVVSADGTVTVTPTTTPGSATAPPETSFDLSVDGLPEQMTFFYTETYTYPGGVKVTAASINNVERKGTIWLDPPVNPTLSHVAGGVLRVSGLFTVPQNFKVEVRIVDYFITKEMQPGSALIITDPIHVEVSNLPVGATADEFDIRFFDISNAAYGYGNFLKKSDSLSDYFTTYTIQVTIYQ